MKVERRKQGEMIKVERREDSGERGVSECLAPLQPRDCAVAMARMMANIHNCYEPSHSS